MVYAYLRVSTDKQDCENQKVGILNLAKKMKLEIDKFIVDNGISGAKNYKDRNLGKLLKKLKENDIVICSEISRIGRKLFMVMEILNMLMSKNCKLYTVKDNFILGDNIQSKVLAFTFSLVAEIERELISARTKEALYKLRLQGKHLGRPFGSKTKNHKLDKFKDYIIKQRKNKCSKLKLAKKCHVAVKTLRKYIISNNLE